MTIRRRQFLQAVPILSASTILCGCPCGEIGGRGVPTIQFTYVPPLGSFDNLHGSVRHVSTCETAVVVYIFVPGAGGWYIKPTFSQSTTSIDTDGTWSVDVTTGGIDHTATAIAAFLVPKGYSPPLLSGQDDLPDELLNTALAHTISARTDTGVHRVVRFSEYEWIVKASDTPVGPGPNVFSDDTANVWVDANGELHLKITKQGGLYSCAEVISRKGLGFGTYMFRLNTRVDNLDPNVVLGLFTWSDNPAFHYREMDIEFSRWQNPNSVPGQFVVQPWDTPGNLERFDVGPEVETTHGFTWAADSVHFFSILGHDYPPSDSTNVIHEWTYRGNDIPPPGGNTNARMNLWLVWGESPTNGEEREIVVSDFDFVPSAG